MTNGEQAVPCSFVTGTTAVAVTVASRPKPARRS
jgi:hypothetical protein